MRWFEHIENRKKIAHCHTAVKDCPIIRAGYTPFSWEATEKSTRTFATAVEAERFKRSIGRKIEHDKDPATLRAKAEDLRRLADEYDAEADRRDGLLLTVENAMEQYATYMLDVKGNKPKTVTTTMYRLRSLLRDVSVSLPSLTARTAAALYEQRCPECAPDTHRNELSQVKTFMRWCMERGWLRRNPFEKVKPVGKRSHGKEQLRLHEARDVVGLAFQLARQELGPKARRRDRQEKLRALSVLVAIYLALRASEVVGIKRRDVDDHGRILWIPDSKTEAGRRTLQVAEVLAPLLWERARECGDDPEALLFPRKRGWVLKSVKRLCEEAKVTKVTAHGARGTHATLATEMGTTSHVVARALGHDNDGVTKRHYIKRGTSEQAGRDQMEKLLSDAAGFFEAGSETGIEVIDVSESGEKTGGISLPPELEALARIGPTVNDVYVVEVIEEW